MRIRGNIDGKASEPLALFTDTDRAAWTGGMKSASSASPLQDLTFNDLAPSFCGSNLEQKRSYSLSGLLASLNEHVCTYFARSIKKRKRLFEDVSSDKDLVSFRFSSDDCAPLKISSPNRFRSGLAELSNHANPHMACSGCLVRILVRIVQTTTAVSLFRCARCETSCGIAV